MKHELELLRAFVRDYRLDQHVPGIDHALSAINPEKPRPTDARVLRGIREQLAPFEAFHRDHPFVVAPPGAFTGEIVLGYQVANRLPITINLHDLTRHMGVWGSSGCGKTTFTAGILEQVRAHRAKVGILDPKDDWLHVAVKDEDFLVLSPASRINLLQIPGFLTPEDHQGVFGTIWGESFYSAENQRQVLDEALTRARATHDQPCLADLEQAAKTMHSPRLTYSRRDAIIGFCNRLARFGTRYPGPYTTRHGITFDQLFQHPFYLNALFNDEHTTFLWSLLVHMLYLHHRKHGIRSTLDYLLVNDEGNRFWNVSQRSITEAPALVDLQGKIREFGVGLLHTSVDETSLHPLLKSNTLIQVAMHVTTGREEREARDNLGLTPEQRAFLRTRLSRGQCIIRLGSSWREPTLTSFPYRKLVKSVPQTARTTAEERINHYAPPNLPPLISATTEQPASTPRPTTPAAKPTLASTPPPTTQEDALPFPAFEDEERRPPLKLTVQDERLLRTTTERLLIATEAYKRAGLARQAGQNAKDKLVTLGLLTQTSILVKPGRGGNALLLEPTPGAYELLGRNRPTGTRGGDSAQHRWLIQELATRIPGAAVEFVLGEKSIDLLIRDDPERHQPILFYIDKKLERDALVAIEVECTRPVQTGANNITKNHEAGVAHTLVAVLPRHVTTTRSGLARRLSGQEGAYSVVDVFALLGRCKQCP